MIEKLLIANRGEIALRVIRAAKEMGIRTVAVCAEDDAASLFVEEADEVRRLGGESPRETYLSPDAILEGARAAGADAVHPGYGFLAENAGFATAIGEAGLTFVGPSPETMAAVGSKTAAKKLAEQSGVPTIPWADALNLDGARLARAAKAIGYPLLIKASAGGGGRGMRIVECEAELADAAAAARAEAKAAFADGSVFLEKRIADPRHIEVQILGDRGGRVVHLLERECSIQRRHQKILEEAPSPAVDGALRARLAAAALKIAKATRYVGAGTVEFLVDADGSFYFMEVNARLQVEHPVTEAITGIDLVAWQLRIAGGEELSLRQDDISARGHAIECRLTAEDPAAGFLPVAGTVRRFSPPMGPGVRVDSGVRSGDVVSSRYDPLVAKVIAHGEDRERTVSRLARALRETVLLGLATNLPLLIAVVDHPAFRRAETTIEFLQAHRAELLAEPTPLRREVIAIALFEAMRTGRCGGAAPGEDGGSHDPWDLARDFGAGA